METWNPAGVYPRAGQRPDTGAGVAANIWWTVNFLPSLSATSLARVSVSFDPDVILLVELLEARLMCETAGPILPPTSSCFSGI